MQHAVHFPILYNYNNSCCDNEWPAIVIYFSRKAAGAVSKHPTRITSGAEARKLVCAQARPEECEEIYRWLYDNLDIISKDEDSQDKAILIIKQGLVDHSFVADPEINLASVMIKLARLQSA